jgi:hypothetical protein
LQEQTQHNNPSQSLTVGEQQESQPQKTVAQKKDITVSFTSAFQLAVLAAAVLSVLLRAIIINLRTYSEISKFSFACYIKVQSEDFAPGW